jgi:uncharacterized phiE125 gp8 family phage protein
MNELIAEKLGIRGCEGTFERHNFRVTVTTQPAAEPISLSEAKLFCRVDGSDEDALISALITAARIAVEEQTGYALVTRTLDAWSDIVPNHRTIDLPFGPVESITHVKSFDEDGDETALTVADDVILDGANSCFAIKSTANTLTSTRSFNAFNVQYIAGYGIASSVPEWAKQAMYMLIAHWYENREAIDADKLNVMPYGARMIIQTHKRV